MWVTYGLLGLGLGAMYSLASQGLLLIYRGSGVLNFAQGVIGVAGAYVEYELVVSSGLPTLLAIILGVLTSAAIGALTHLLVMRHLRRASPLARIVATLGVLITIQALLLQIYGATVKFTPNSLPTTRVHFGGSVVVSSDRFILLGIAAALTFGLWAMYKYTKFGIGTAAVAENQRAASTLGWSPDLIATVNWALGSALAGLAAILVSPIVTLQVSILTNLVLAALAAALVASFTSFPIAFVAALIIGVAETELQSYVNQPGLAQSVPFVVIVVVMIVRGQALPLRDFFLQRLPQLGDGRLRPRSIICAVIAGALLILFTGPEWQLAFINSMATALILLSIVVLTGYTGQLSLAQFSIAGFGAWVAGRLAAGSHVPFLLAAVLGVLLTVPLGVAFVIPAARTRGINFAVVTLGLGSALELMLFDNDGYTGGLSGTQVGSPHIFGLNVNAITEPARYGIMTLIVLVIASLVVTNVRRGRSGRRLIAVRTNERAAAALGVNVRLAKLYAFGLSAGIAATGGILLAFSNSTITYSNFTNAVSINDVGWAMIGGVGYVLGPIFASTTFAPGGVGAQVSFDLINGLGNWITLIGGVSVILIILVNQDGLAKENGRQLLAFGEKLDRRGLHWFRARPLRPTVLPDRTAVRVAPRTLEVEGLTVRYGPTVAVDDVSLTVSPGRVLGLIGPNGAGKTTFIDAVTGFTQPSIGRLLYDGEPIDDWSVAKRARRGISRSFQSLELFEDSTVVDNLAVASDLGDLMSYVRDLVWPVQPVLSGESVAAIHEFRLEADLDRKVVDLSYGKRRLLAIARAVASRPSVLLLDEPAAGLGDAETAELGQLVGRLATEWGMAILVIEHDMNFVMNVCDDIVVLDFGRKIAHGTPAVIRSHPDVVAAYLGDSDLAEGVEGAAVPSMVTEEA